MHRQKLLFEIILDKDGEWADRHDALIDLHKYDNQFIEDALMQLILAPDEDNDLRAGACETLASYWMNTGTYNLEKYLQMSPP